MLELIGGLLALGIAAALTVSIVGLAMLGLLIWGGISLVNRLTGKTRRQQSLPSSARRRDLPASPPQARAQGQNQAQAPAGATYADVARDYEYLDVAEGATADQIRAAVAPYEGAPYVGEYARGVISTLKKAEFRRKGLFTAIDREFEAHSMTWEKFVAPVEVAMDGIMHNCAQLGNRVQGFDIAEYERLSRLVDAGVCTEGSSKWERWQLFGNTLTEMDDLQRSNDQLLFELERLQDELSRIGGKSGGSSTDEIAEEIRKLSEEAKYYS